MYPLHIGNGVINVWKFVSSIYLPIQTVSQLVNLTWYAKSHKLSVSCRQL